jgi:hypothetical protein
MNNSDYTSRKFILTLACGAVVTVAFFLGKIDQVSFLAFLTTNVIGYGVLNLLDKPADIKVNEKTIN